MKSHVFISAYETFYSENKPRLISTACYFGFTSILWAAKADKQKNRFLRYHFQNSLTLSLLLFFFVVTYMLTTLLIYVNNLYYWKPSLEEINALGWLIQLSDYTNTAILLALIIIWCNGVISTWAGRTPHIPFLSKIARHNGWMKFSLYWTVFVQAFFIFLLFIALHGASLTRASSGPAQVYILYTQGGYIPLPHWYESYTPPRWTISLFFYPIVLAANQRWGNGNVAIQPLSDVSFREAIQYGRFVFVASHGGIEPGSFAYSFVPYKGFLPSDVMPEDSGPQLRYVYFAACYAGLRESDWEAALYPAQVRSFDRVSFVDEHFLWVWFKGARVIRDIE